MEPNAVQDDAISVAVNEPLSVSQNASPPMAADPCDAFTRDQYGFLIDSGFVSQEAKIMSPERIRLDNSRLTKWAAMLSSDMKVYKSNPKMVRRRVRKGIPDPVRGFVWKILAGSNIAQAEAPKGYYHQTLAVNSSTWEAQIERDIHRTFPRHILFRDQASIGQHALFNVLKVYSIYDNELGYCQGMGFIAGMFLMHMGEEDAFWMLVSLLTGDGFKMRSLYISGMPLTLVRVYQLRRLLERRYPAIMAHFEKENVDLMSLTMQWFITNFCYNLPFRVLLRVWDIFLLEKSPKIIFRVALYFFDKLQSQFLKSDFETIMTCMKEFYLQLDPEETITKALKIKLKKKELQLLEESYAVSSR